MNNAQIANKIRQTCKEKNITISQLLEKCEVRKSLMYDLEKRDYTPSVAIINVIADYLNVSVDYLLGRTDEPKTIGGHSIKIEDIHGDHSANVNIGENIDKETLEIAQMIKKLSIVQRAEIILKTNEMINENKE